MVGAAETAEGYGGLAKNQSIIYAEIIADNSRDPWPA